MKKQIYAYIHTYIHIFIYACKASVFWVLFLTCWRHPCDLSLAGAFSHLVLLSLFSVLLFLSPDFQVTAPLRLPLLGSCWLPKQISWIKIKTTLVLVSPTFDPLHLHKYFLHSLVGKESACNAEDLGSIPGSGRSPREGNGYPSSILAWRIPWTEEPGRLQSTGSQQLDTTERLNHHHLHGCTRVSFSLISSGSGDISEPLLLCCQNSLLISLALDFWAVGHKSTLSAIFVTISHLAIWKFCFLDLSRRCHLLPFGWIGGRT